MGQVQVFISDYRNMNEMLFLDWNINGHVVLHFRLYDALFSTQMTDERSLLSFHAEKY